MESAIHLYSSLASNLAENITHYQHFSEKKEILSQRWQHTVFHTFLLLEKLCIQKKKKSKGKKEKMLAFWFVFVWKYNDTMHNHKK